MAGYKIKEIKKLQGKIRVESGLHIGAGSDKIEIGGMDNPIIKNPVTQEPYIPGSSLKGKMRSLMEWKLGKVLGSRGAPCGCGECEVCRVFGTSAAARRPEEKDKAMKRGPTRIILRDARLSERDREKFGRGEILIEEKSENSLNRITAEANPRPLERVVPGTEFDFSLIYKILDMGDEGAEDEKNFSAVVLTALALLEQDYLGGGGSRGNGRISFQELKDEKGSPVQLPTV